MKKYKVIKQEDTDYKYYKNIPYIPKKYFNDNGYKLIGQTKLKEINKDREYDGIIKYDDIEYIVDDYCFGMEKGYIQVGENSYIVLKRIYPIIIFLILGLLLLGISLGIIITLNHKKVDLVSPVVEQIKEPEPTKEEKKIIYKISFDSNDGVGKMDSIDILENETRKLPKNNFKKKGYTFIGWALSKFGQVIYSDEDIIENLNSDEKEIVLYAVFSVNKYKVTFLDFNDNVLYEQFQNYNSLVELPENPKREGYTFLRWDNNTTKITSQTTYKALYEPSPYNISYDLNGGILKNKPSIFNIESMMIEVPNPKKIGYTFIGWTVNDSKNSIKNFILPTGSYGNKHLKANYKPNLYKISFDTNGSEDDIKDKKVYFNSQYGELPEPTREGYTFTGWTNNKGEVVDENTIYNVANDVVLKATWNANEYEVKLNPNNGKVDPEKVNVIYDSTYGELPEPTREGYNFKGWYLGDKLIKDDTIIKTSSSHELVAKWKKINYVIEYNSLGGILTANVTIYNIEDDDFDLPEPTREGYTFIGWTGANGETPEKTVTIKSGTTGNYKYYANWEVISYNISYNLNGGKLDNKITQYNVETPDITLPEPTREGYTFTGWTGANGETPEKTVIISQGSLGNKKYEANWQINYYTVNYYINNALWTTRSVAYQGVVPNLAYETNDKQTFSGWDGFRNIMGAGNLNVYGTVRETNCMVRTGHGTQSRVSAFISVFNSAGFNAYLISSNGAYAVETDQIYAYSTAVNMLNYVWANTSSSGSHALNYIELHCDNNHSFSQSRP